MRNPRTALFSLIVALFFIPSLALASSNAADLAGAVAVGSSYAGAVSAPTNGMAVQGSVGIGTASPIVSLDMSQKTDALALPVGTSGTRPTGVSLINGQIRYNTSTPGLEAYVNGAWVAISGGGGTSSAINSSGRLTGSSTTLSYCPYKGNLKTTVLYGDYTIPSACLTASLTSMYIGGTASQAAATSTRYYVYLINVSGTTFLDLETTGHATDSSTGIEIMSGNNTRTLVGMIHTDSSGKVNVHAATVGDTNTVATWDNRRPTSTQCGFTVDRSLTGTVGEVEINSENRCYFMSWGDAVLFTSNQNGFNNTAGSDCFTAISIDNGGALALFDITPVGNGAGSLSSYRMNQLAPASEQISEGYHFTTLYGTEGSGSTCTWAAGSPSYFTYVYTVQ